MKRIFLCLMALVFVLGMAFNGWLLQYSDFTVCSACV